MIVNRRTVFTIICMLALLAGTAGVVTHAQQAKPQRDVFVYHDGFAFSFAGQGSHAPHSSPELMIASQNDGNNFVFVSSEMSFDWKVVKGAPYSAQAVTETIQALADGNRIVRKNTASVYRDGEGRTRREQTIGGVGSFAPAGDPPQTIFINDPVAGVNFILNPREKKARKVALRVELRSSDPAQGVHVLRRSPRAPRPEINVSVDAAVSGGDVVVRTHHDRMVRREPKTEALGTQVIEGIEAEGTRSTVTIPAGEIGNELPIDIVSETWYSPELQMTVMKKHSDPRFGDTTYRLTNIIRSEPAASLFELPSDYTVDEVMPHERRLKIEREIRNKVPEKVKKEKQ